MKNILSVVLFMLIYAGSYGQYVNEDSLKKYSNPAEQEKVFSAMAKSLKLSTDKETLFKGINYAYANKALGVVKNNKLNWYSRGMQLQDIKKEHAGKMKQVLTASQFTQWEKERDKNGIVKRIML